MIVLLAIDNGLDKSISQSVLRLRFPDNTDFRFNDPKDGWISFCTNPDYSDPLGEKRYFFQMAYVVAVMPDEMPVEMGAIGGE